MDVYRPSSVGPTRMARDGYIGLVMVSKGFNDAASRNPCGAVVSGEIVVAGEGRGAIDSDPALDLGRVARPNWPDGRVFNAEQSDGTPALEPERTYQVEQAEKLLHASGSSADQLQ
jgi:hypothetical protein